MVGACATHAEGMARDKTVLLVTACGEVAKATQSISIFGDELAATRQPRDATEDKISSLTAKAATTDQ
jgi:hypothetical protein